MAKVAVRQRGQSVMCVEEEIEIQWSSEEVRLAKVLALRNAIAAGSYRVSSLDLADSLVRYMLAPA